MAKEFRDKYFRQFEAERLVREDKTFLVSLIDNPVKTLAAYNIEVKDDEMLRVLDGIAADIRERAAALFIEGGLAETTQNCQCCG